MYFVIAAVALAALTKAAVATPLGTTTTPVSPIAKGVTTGAHFPVHALGSPSAKPQTSFTASSTGTHADAADDIYPATLLLCEDTACASCFAYDLSTLPVNACLLDTSSTFYSVAISQPSNEGLPFAVVVGEDDCDVLAKIPEVNACLVVPPGNEGPYTDFAILT